MGFSTKDSGRRMEFASGMRRDTQEGKTLYHLVFDGPLLQRWAELLTRGAEKYDPGNWMKAEGQGEYERFKASASRHFFQWMRGDIDEDHAAAVVFNLNGAEYVRNKIIDAAGAKALAEFQMDRRLPEPDLMGHMMAGTDYFPPVSAAEGIITDPNDSRRGDAGVVLLEPVTFNGVPVEYVPDLARDYETGEPLDLDKCGTLDGVTPLPPSPVVTVLAKDHSKEALAQALQDTLNACLGEPTYQTILAAYRERAMQDTAVRQERFLWDLPEIITFRPTPKPSRWQRFKAWLCDVFIPPGGGCGHLN